MIPGKKQKIIGLHHRQLQLSHPPNGVFTQEVKLHHELVLALLVVQLDVLHPETAAAHGVRLVLVLLVT